MEDTNNVSTGCYSYNSDEKGKIQVVCFGMASLDEKMPCIEIPARDIDLNEIDRHIREQLEAKGKAREKYAKITKKTVQNQESGMSRD